MTQRSPQPVSKPVPQPDETMAPFYDGAKRGELMILRCKQCRVYLAPGVLLCPECLSEDLEWVRSSGRGTLFTFGIMHQRYHPGFFGEIPYNVAVVELAEGPRLNTNIAGAPNSSLKIGMPVVVTFEKLTDEVTIPKFKPA